MKFHSTDQTDASPPGSRRFLREVAVLLAFFALTSLMTWPWVTRLRDAVADEGDPYMIAWTLWWDYHQTFNDLLHLFNANVFYPYKYTLAFSEHEYGIALLFFPLFALGLRPLTVQAVAIFCGFAFSGYGAFRLTRTLTRANGPAWIAGIIFAFVPYRFHLLSHLHYLFAGWIPLLFESLILFARQRTWRRAAWLGVAFAMNALSCTTYLILTLIPLALSAAFLVLNYGIERDRAFWVRGATALTIASVVLLPFMVPYYFVMKLYGFVRTADEVAINSPTPVHWLAGERRSKLWSSLGTGIPNATYKLFPGLLPLLLPIPVIFATPKADSKKASVLSPDPRARLLRVLDTLVILALVVAILALGYQGENTLTFGESVLKALTPARAGFFLLIVIVCRLVVTYPKFMTWPREKNLIETIRRAGRGDAVALPIMWIVCGFLGSLGMNFFINRVLYDFIPLFRAIRVPSHWAMVAYLGLAVVSGLGTQKVAERLARWRKQVRPAMVFALIGAALLIDLRAAPLAFVRGKVFPDQITLRLKKTPMRGGIVELPHDLNLATPHLYMLRAADHQKPLVNASSSFVSPISWDIQQLSEARPLPIRLLDLLESIPASYLVIHNSALTAERRMEYEMFLGHAVASNRLRFINSFGDRDDLYAIVKTEPQTISEVSLPFKPVVREWASLIEENPVNILGSYRSWAQALYRFYVASYGRMPRYAEFLPDTELISRGVVVGSEDEGPKLEYKLQQFALGWVERREFKELYNAKSNDSYVDALTANSGIKLDSAERTVIIEKLNSGAQTRGQVLLDVVNNQEFNRKSDNPSLVLLHYFGYLRRNPDDLPDKNLTGFYYWVNQLELFGDRKLTRAFNESIEYKTRDRS
jgi:hypothetical protein